MAVREVWRHNLESEMIIFSAALHRFDVLTIDTEFPGCVRRTPRHAMEKVLYEDVKYNVDNTILIQLGITLSNNVGETYTTWQFNFANFDPKKDVQVKCSVDLLTKNGIDFEKMKKDGIDLGIFADKFGKIVSTHTNLKWVTFHGLYDMAYLLKLLTKKLLPETIVDFTKRVGELFGLVYDVKYMARYCDGLLHGEIGLQRIANIIGVERNAVSHQAGFDSLVTAYVLWKMKKLYKVDENFYEGFLYGIRAKILDIRSTVLSTS